MVEKEEVKVENIVGSGKLNFELDLAAVCGDLQKQEGIKKVRHSREGGNRLLIYFEDDRGFGILSPNSVYIFNGVKNFEQLEYLEQKLLFGLSELNIISDVEPSDEEMTKPLEVQNVVCTGDLHRTLNLEALAIGLGLEFTEYEPEQFPGLIYKPETSEGTILLFSTGKAVITGVSNKEAAQSAFNSTVEEVKRIFD